MCLSSVSFLRSFSESCCLLCLLCQCNRVHCWIIYRADIKNSSNANWVKTPHSAHIQPSSVTKGLGQTLVFVAKKQMNGNCGLKEGWAGERYSTMTWNMKRKSSLSFFNQLEPVVFGDRCREEGWNRHKWCAGWHLPLHHPALCFCYPQVLLWGLPVRKLQQQHSRCGHRFLWGVKRTVIPPNPSAAFPEAEEFSLNPKEKYLYMWFYDLKSVDETDLSPHFPEESWVKRCCFQILRCMVGFYTCKETNEALQLVQKSDTTQRKKGLHCLCNSRPSPVLFMLHQQII